jgi:hypothetical protein
VCAYGSRARVTCFGSTEKRRKKNLLEDRISKILDNLALNVHKD